jgi:glycosyltransferase involved in cell wall biosynthesis
MQMLVGGSYKTQSKITDSSEPLLSIIIVTLNRAQYIERSLSSVIHEIQTNYKNTELIIIDGGSSDNTVDILKKHDKYITYWISEPDSGVSEAVNKGLAQARGEIIRFLGDDDEVIPGWTHHMISYLVSQPTLDVLIGHSQFILVDINGNQSPLPLRQPSGKLNYRDILHIGGITGQPSPEVTFFRREVFEKYGGYDMNFRYFAYIEQWLRFAKAGVTFEAIPITIAKRYQTPQSDSIRGNRQKINDEHHRLMRKHADFHWWLTVGYKIQLHRLSNSLNFHPFQIIRKVTSILTQARA